MSESSSRTGKKGGARRFWGVVLLVVALVAILKRNVPLSSEKLVLPQLGIGFIVWAVVGRVSGFLSPGGILSGIGLGFWLQRFYGLGAGTGAGQALYLGCLALGFLLITLLSLLCFRSRVVWPLWPASFIALAAVVRLMGSGWQEYGWRIQPYWPFAVLVIALWLLFSSRGGSKS